MKNEIKCIEHKVEYLKEFKTDKEYLKVTFFFNGEKLITFIPYETIENLKENPKMVSFETNEEEDN